MPTFTSGKVSVLPVGTTTSASLLDLQSAMTKSRPSHANLTGGWASISDVQSNLRQYDAAPPVSDPEIIPEVGDHPEHLLARYYYFVRDTAREKSAPKAPVASHHRLEAVDVLITRTSTASLLVLFSSRNISELTVGTQRVRQKPTKTIGAMTAFEKLLQSLDDKARVSLNSSSLMLGTPDFFLWLMARWRDTPDLDPATAITAVNGLNGQDKVSRTTLLQQDVDFNRVGLLTSIAESDVLGPVKIALSDTTRSAKLDIELWVDGGFAVHLIRTHYSNIVGSSATRLRAVLDLAFVFVPMLRDLYAADTAWVRGNRGLFIREASDALANRYTTKILPHAPSICDSCGQPVLAA